MANCRRLFISGIPEEASEDEIKRRFGVFGDVSSIEKVVRNHEGFPTKCFVYLDISLSDANYHKCLSLYSKAKWKGNQLIIQPAKESFLKRLEAERQQQQTVNESQKPNNSHNCSSSELQVRAKDGKRLIKVNHLKSSKKIKRFSSQSIMENNVSVSELTWDLNPTTSSCKTNSTATLNGLPAERQKKDKITKRIESNNLRLKALEKLQDHHKPLVIEGSKVNSHIVFEPEDKMEEGAITQVTHSPKEKKTLLPLFGSDSEDNGNDGNEMTKSKFEGKQGSKLFKLQQKIGWDKRFEVDERFLNDTDSSSDEVEDDTPVEEDNEMITSDDDKLDRERQRNLELIEEMFGNTSSVTAIPETQVIPEVQRYDPSAVGSELLEKRVSSAKKRKKKSDEDVKAVTPSISTQEVTKPKVSNECFYSVSDSLKDVLTVSGGHTFNFTTSTPKERNNTTTAMAVTSMKKPTWLTNFQDGDEMLESDESTVNTTELSSNGQKRILFFFHSNSTELRNRLDCPDTKFHRMCSLEELETKWPQMRTRLKEQYKRRHRDALRWLRQRKQINLK